MVLTVSVVISLPVSVRVVAVCAEQLAARAVRVDAPLPFRLGELLGPVAHGADRPLLCRRVDRLLLRVEVVPLVADLDPLDEASGTSATTTATCQDITRQPPVMERRHEDYRDGAREREV